MSERTQKTFNPFRVLSNSEREQHLADYQAFLEERDGPIDVDAFTLAHRESYLQELEDKPVRWTGDVDDAAFYQHVRKTGSPPLDERTSLLVSAALANVGESYGVEVELDAFSKRPHRASENPLYMHLMFEERYHTRILDEMCRVCGLEPERRSPSWHQRVIINWMMYLPDRLRWIPIFAGEVLGSVVFQLLLESVEHFSEEPEVEERVRSLLTEIWIDEVGHVAYLRAKMGPMGVQIARALLPMIAASLFKDVPANNAIGLHRERVMERLRDGVPVPPGFGWMAPDPA
ncbi:MAG: hypothetical protein AAF430_15110 [Myxococcota bacterium]